MLLPTVIGLIAVTDALLQDSAARRTDLVAKVVRFNDTQMRCCNARKG